MRVAGVTLLAPEAGAVVASVSSGSSLRLRVCLGEAARPHVPLLMRTHLALFNGPNSLAAIAAKSEWKQPAPEVVSATKSSGYSNAFFRDAPPSADLDDKSVGRASFSRPQTATLDEMGFDFDSYAPKDALPLKSCLKRGETKEPRFHPFKMGSELGAHALISPTVTKSDDYLTRFQKPAYVGKGPMDIDAPIMKNKGVTPESGFSMGNSQGRAVKVMITARQGQAEFRAPALTMLDKERVQNDSTRRYFHARDHYEQPYLSSSAYFQNDVVSSHKEMKRRGEGLTITPSIRPLTQYALAKAPVPYDEPPFAPDQDASWTSPARDLPGPPPIGQFAATAAGVPLSEQKLPTGFSRVRGLTVNQDTGPELPDAPPLPERFQRERARRDYLKWGANDDKMYKSIQRVELAKPVSRVPPDGRIVATDSSGYHMQHSVSPIVGRE